jgi:2,3-bisphosphoglycerate-independent phosphoglycerate mutase
MPEETPSKKLKSQYRPVVLLILDGFGVNVTIPDSTWRYAKRPTLNDIEKNYPFTTAQASGISVGLPWNEAGNSEIGHLTIGAGRVLYHHLPRIISSIGDGTFFKNEAFLAATARAKEPGRALHIMGLFSSGSVHAYVEHLYALMDLAKQENVPEVNLHLYGDGKDAPTHELLDFMGKFLERLKDYPNIRVASVLGRYYSMDRDENWDRIEVAYNLLTQGVGAPYKDPMEHVKAGYDAGKTDTHLDGGFLADENGAPLGRIKNGDAVIFHDFREDSVRELTSAFVDERFDRFLRGPKLDLLFVTMTEYDARFPVKVAFPSLDVAYPLARVVSEGGLKQMHIAESEKYAHVTYFFNAGKESPYPGEDRMLVASLEVHSFDERPEMSAAEIVDAVIANLSKYDLIIANLANGDMVGHTGNFDATVKALEVLDFSVGKIMPKVLELGGALLITADHGNAEEKRYRTTGEKRTQHSNNPVPCYLIANESRRAVPLTDDEVLKKYKDVGGVLTDIAPTLLELLGLRVPNEMTGESLITKLTTDN